MNQVLPRQRTPSAAARQRADVRLILVGDAERQPIERRVARRREMKDELVAVVQEAVAVDRLVVADGEVARQAGGGAGRLAVDRDRLDPVNDVLEPQVRSRGLRDVERCPRVGWPGADIQKQRAVRLEHPCGRGDPLAGPPQVVSLLERVLVCVVPDAQVVRAAR